MTLPADTLYTLLACTTVCSVGVLAIAVLPWHDDELDESWLAWSTLAGLSRRAIALLRGLGHDPAPPAPLHNAQAGCPGGCA